MPPFRRVCSKSAHPYHRSPGRFQAAPGTDVAVLAVQRRVAVVPLTVDLTARDGWAALVRDLGLPAVDEPGHLDPDTPTS